MLTIKKTAISLLSVGVSMLLAIQPASAQTSCDRACLTGFLDAWYKALVSNNAASVPAAKDVKITQNGQAVKMAGTFWDSADSVPYRWDIANSKLGDTASEAVIKNADGSLTMLIVRLKVKDGAITEVETIKTNKGEAGGLWGPEILLAKGVSSALQLSIRDAERDSYYRLIAAGESYWRAFQANGTPSYHPADLLPDTTRFENGLQTTGLVRNGVFNSASKGFDEGSFLGRNLWDRRYAVVDEERGIVLCMVRFGLKEGAQSKSTATADSRIVGEFFAVKRGYIQEVHAVLFNVPDTAPTGWTTTDYTPARGGVGW